MNFDHVVVWLGYTQITGTSYGMLTNNEDIPWGMRADEVDIPWGDARRSGGHTMGHAHTSRAHPIFVL